MSTLDMAEGRNLQRQEHINRNLLNKAKRNSAGCGKLRTGVTRGNGNTRRGRNRKRTSGTIMTEFLPN